MIIIGERINASRTPVKRALEGKDSSFILNEAQRQADAGCQFLDVNCGLSGEKELEDMEWLVTTIQDAVDINLCIDSPDHRVIERGVSLCKKKALINSITAETSRLEPIIPIAKKYDCGLIALTMDERGMPETSEDRFTIARRLYNILKKNDIADEDIFFDALVRPVSSEPKQAEELLKSIPKIKSLGNVKAVSGISNVSYGLPKRGVINSVFLSIALSAGMDGAIMDPLDKKITAAYKTAEALLGRDRYCMNFIQAHRKGLL